MRQLPLPTHNGKSTHTTYPMYLPILVNGSVSHSLSFVFINQDRNTRKKNLTFIFVTQKRKEGQKRKVYFADYSVYFGQLLLTLRS